MKIKSCYINYNSYKQTFFNATDFDSINPISIVANLIARNMICCTDSYGILNKYSNLNILQTKFLPIKKDIEKFDKSFEEITDKRIDELINLSNKDNKNICLFWSGGIDSQVILSGLLLHKFPLNRLILLTNNYAIEKENNNFYKKYIENKIKCIIGMENIYNYLQTNSNYICTDGDYGGNLVTSVFNYIHNNYFYINWKDVLKWIYVDNNDNNNIFKHRNTINIDNDTFDFIINEWDKLFNYIDINVKTMGAFMHLAEYNLCSVSDSLEFMLMFNVNYENYYEFYSYSDYHKWALLNYINNMDKDNIVLNPKICKIDYKKYIYKYDKDINYLNTKSKELSMDHLFDDSNKDYLFINKNFIRILYEDNNIKSFYFKKNKYKNIDKIIFINNIKKYYK